MAFTDTEFAEHTALIKEPLLSGHRPPLHLSDQTRRWQFSLLSWNYLRLVALAMLVLHAEQSRADDLAVETIGLPSLRIDDQLAKAHTQGLELVDGKYYVTARRDDVRPKRALLLRAVPKGTACDVWDITPKSAPGDTEVMDHPGGLQSDGTRLWIPLAESKRNGRSLIRAYRLKDIEAGRRLESDFEFPVNDHIGAVAVSVERQILLGANWDTEKVYAWDFKGQLQWTLAGADLKARGLGFVASADGRAGVTVQDWKFVGDRLFASGLFRSSGSASVPPASRLCWFEHFQDRDFRRGTVVLPRQAGTELAREGMAITAGMVYFLPEDLSVSNRLFRMSVAGLMQQGETR